ncbi:MAG: HEPN domain-containing protein [Candidatus Margulisbacteria bacterium]|jgi:HEPN domain-containing protein|nr:HEPN domain-containing protein [Candidatus Margulisiibacteriota bacterium]
MDSLDPHRWREFAEMDLNAAEHLLNTMRPAPYEIICYHCQQSAEKYLKGYLILCTKAEQPHIHDLAVLCKLCEKINPLFSQIMDICSELTEYGIQPKYPLEMYVEKADALNAIQDAKNLRNFLQNHAAELFSAV